MGKKLKQDLEREIVSLEERLHNQSAQIAIQGSENKKLRKQLAGRRLGNLFPFLLGASAIAAGLYVAEWEYSGSIGKIFKQVPRAQSHSPQGRSVSSLSSVIDTVPELQEFLGIKKTSDEQFNDSQTKAYIQAFQEKCHYVLDLPMAITGEPSIETYVTATVIQNSPELLVRLRRADHYSYTNRRILDYDVRIPNIAISQAKSRLRNNEDIAAAVDYRDPTVERIAREVTAGKENALAKATRLLEFVQALPYDFDIDDYPKHPLETLADGGGDCEDTSILYASLARAAGISSAVASVPQHAMAAVDVPNAQIRNSPGWYVESHQKKYTLVETTGNRQLGDIAQEYQQVPTELIFPLD